MGAGLQAIQESSRTTAAMADHSIFAVLVNAEVLFDPAFTGSWNPHHFEPRSAIDTFLDTDVKSHLNDYKHPGKFGDLQRGAHLVLTLDRLPKDPAKGWVIGHDKNVCDIYVGIGTGHISAEHCRIQIDDQHRVWLFDQSSHGTIVAYGRHCSGLRRSDRFFLHSRFRSVDVDWKKIRIEVDHTKFYIYFPNHNSPHPEYEAKLRRYCEAAQDALPPMHGLGLASRITTMQPTEAAPSGRQVSPFMIDMQTLYKVDHCHVTVAFNTREGYVCVQKKTFHTQRANHRLAGQTEEAWLAKTREQVATMQKLNHPNIARVLDFWEQPSPTLLMPYYSGGDLHHFLCERDRRPLEVTKVRDLMRQLLSGVAKLHARGVVHRDLKSLNIAIESSDNPFSVVILDFDLASTNPNGVMRTVCGTQGYFAPEIYDRDKTSRKPVGYSSKVDVWSLGMVFLEAIRPDFAKELHGECATHEYNGTPAGFSLNHYVRFVNEELTRLDGNVQFSQGEKKIIKAMLDANPKNRVTAAQCLEYACDIGLFRKSNEGEFIYEAGRGPITDLPVLPVEENLATIAEHAQEDDSAPPAAEAGPCYNIPSEATTHQESGNNTPRATECDTPQVFVSCVEEIDDTQGEEEPDEYSPAPSGSRAPLHPDFFQPSDYRGSYYVETPRFVESEAVRVLPDEKDNVTPHPIEMLPETSTAFGWDDETPQVNEMDDETSPAIETDAGYEVSVEPSSTAGSDDSFVGTTAAHAPGQSVKASTDTSSRVSGDELASFVEHQSEIVCGGDHNHEDQTDNASTGSAVQNLIHVELLESSSWKRRAPDDDEGSTTDAQAGSTKRVKASL